MSVYILVGLIFSLIAYVAVNVKGKPLITAGVVSLPLLLSLGLGACKEYNTPQIEPEVVEKVAPSPDCSTQHALLLKAGNGFYFEKCVSLSSYKISSVGDRVAFKPSRSEYQSYKELLELDQLSNQ